MTPSTRRRLAGFVLWLLLAGIGLHRDLVGLARHALSSELHSHIVLVPFVSAYLVAARRKTLCRSLRTSVLPATALILAAATVLTIRWRAASAFSINDSFALAALAGVLLIIGGGFLLFGTETLRTAALPAAFLLFAIPLPDHAAACLERQSQLASADWADHLFQLAGVPALRDRNLFQLPGIVIEVARECSGIRSSWVLLITAVAAGGLLLKSPWTRIVLVAAIVPLAILRNAFRILVIGWLCVERGPHMIDSPIHHRGGPVFFALSLIPLFLLLWLLRKRERSRETRKVLEM